MPNPSRLVLVAIPLFVFAGVWMLTRRGLGPAIISASGWAREASIATLSWLFLGVGMLAIIVVLLAALLIGTVKIGGKDAPLRVTPGEGVAIGFAATTSLSLLFWAGGEPLFHFHVPPEDFSVRAESRDAAIIARAAAYFHWAVLSHAIFGLFMVAFAISAGTLGGRASVESALAGRKLLRPTAWGDLVDTLVVLFAVLAVIGTVATAAVSIMAQGLSFSGTGLRPFAMTALVIALVLAAVFIGARPIGASMATASRVTLGLLMLFLVLVVVMGPKGPIIIGGFRGLVAMVREFPTLMFGGFLGYPQDWAGRWTMTHLGSWLVLAPLLGYTLSRAAQGYSLLMAIRMFVFAPMLLSILVIWVLGGLTLAMDDGGKIWAQVPRLGSDSALLLAMNNLWAPRMMRGLLLLLSVLFFITFAGAMTHALVHIGVTGPDADRRVITERRALLILWTIGLGGAGWSLVHYSGASATMAVSQLGAIPGVFIALGVAFTVLRLSLGGPSRLHPPLPPVDPGAKPRHDDTAQVVGEVRRGTRRKDG